MRPSRITHTHHFFPASSTDAYDVCSLIPSPNERSQCYSCWGIDGERMAAYYDTVLSLESALTTASDADSAAGQQQAQERGGGGFMGASFWWLGGAKSADPDDFHSATASMAE